MIQKIDGIGGVDGTVFVEVHGLVYGIASLAKESVVQKVNGVVTANALFSI